MVLRSQFVLCGFVFLAAIAAESAGADPIRVTGDVRIDDIPRERSIDAQLRIGELDFFVSASNDGPRRNFFPAEGPRILQSGAPADLSSRFEALLHARGGPGDIRYMASFAFMADPSVLTCSVDEDTGGAGCSSVSRFLLSGTLIGQDLAGRHLFGRQVFGTGTVQVGFQGVVTEGVAQGRARDFFYKFDVDPAPVPEPATLLLFGTGAAAACGRAWRRRKKAPDEEYA